MAEAVVRNDDDADMKTGSDSAYVVRYPASLVHWETLAEEKLAVERVVEARLQMGSVSLYEVRYPASLVRREILRPEIVARYGSEVEADMKMGSVSAVRYPSSA